MLVLLDRPDVLDFAGQVVVVGLNRGTALRYLREARTPCPRPSRLVSPSPPLFVGRRALVAHVDRGRGALEHVELPDNLGEFRHRLNCGRAGADDADRLAT